MVDGRAPGLDHTVSTVRTVWQVKVLVEERQWEYNQV
jgi:hypothetical protein